jgi:hypothetical protein
MKIRHYRRWLVFAGCCLLLLAISRTVVSSTAELVLTIAGEAGDANDEPLVTPDCENSTLKISPCQPVAATWLAHLNARAHIFADAFRAAGHEGEVTGAVLDCSLGISYGRKTRDGTRWSRHAFAEACDGTFVQVNDVRFDYRRAVRDEASADRAFFVAFLDGWGDVGPGCIPEKGYKILAHFVVTGI